VGGFDERLRARGQRAGRPDERDHGWFGIGHGDVRDCRRAVLAGDGHGNECDPSAGGDHRQQLGDATGPAGDSAGQSMAPLLVLPASHRVVFSPRIDDELVLVELAKADADPAGEPVRSWHDQHARLAGEFGDRHGELFELILAKARERQVDVPGDDVVDITEEQLANTHGGRLAALAERRQRPGKQTTGSRAEVPDDERLVPGSANRLHGALGLLQQLLAIAEECDPGGGQFDPPASAGQERHSELRLEPPDLLAERRLGDVQPLGGAPEVEFLGDGHEVPHEPQIKLIHRYSLPVAAGLVLDFTGFAAENRRRSDESEAAVTDVETAARDVFALPGDAVFPESVGVDPRDGAAYVGSLADGTLYRAQLPETVEIVSAGGTDGRGSVAGVKFDAEGRLWAAGGYEGSLFVYAIEPWELLAKLDVGSRPSCVNDIAFGLDGAAYVTDSFVPTLFRVDPDTLVLGSFCDLDANGVPWPEGLNFNGIVLTADQRHLVACQTNTGRYWQITIEDGSIDEVALDGGPFPHSDGLAIDGTTLYAAVNAHNTIAVIDLEADGGSGAVRGFVRSPDFRFPTAVAVAGDGLWVVNGQLDRLGGTPDLPFTIATIPTPALP